MTPRPDTSSRRVSAATAQWSRSKAPKARRAASHRSRRASSSSPSRWRRLSNSSRCPREVGELDGEKLVVGLGKYGPYVRYGKSFASLAKGDDPYTLTRERAVEIVREHQAAVAAANTPLKSFAEDPDMLVKNGRYGAYIAYKGKNYRIPKGTKPEELTLEACLKIVAGSKK